MTSFDRRSLFSLGLASAGVTAAPGWLTRWFDADDSAEAATPRASSEPQDPKKIAAAARLVQLGEAIGRAKREGKPLLLFVVPENINNGAWERGRWFGAFLNHAPAVAKMEVAMTVLACAKVSELKKIVDVKCEGEPLLLLVDVHQGESGTRRKVTPVSIKLGQLGLPRVAGADAKTRTERQKEYIDGRLEELGNELIKAMHRHGHNLATAARLSMSKLNGYDTMALNAWFDGGKKPADSLLVRAAAKVRRRAASKDGESRKQMMKDLVVAFDRSVVKQPVAGARWMIPGGCGAKPERQTKEEKENALRIACGMAQTPSMCRRFLSFFATP